MNPQQARQAVAETFPQPFDKGRFLEFSRNLLNKFDESNAKGREGVKPCLCVFLRLPRRPFGQDWIAMKKIAHRHGLTPLTLAEELETLVCTNLQRATRLRQSILKKAFTGKL